MRHVFFATLKTLLFSARSVLLAALSCVVLAAVLMIVFNEMGLLRLTSTERMIQDWHGRHAAARAAE